jgi:hypothetical protein
MDMDQAVAEVIASAERGDSDPPLVAFLHVLKGMVENQRKSVTLLENILAKLEYAYPDKIYTSGNGFWAKPKNQ